MDSNTVLDLADRIRLQRLRLAGVKSLTVSTRWGELHVLDAPGRGAGPPVVLLHGLGSCALDFDALLLALRRRHQRVLAPDLGGHGRSPVPPGGMSAEALGAVLDAVLASLLSAPAVVLGNSLGGLAAIRYAQSHPERVLALVLVSPGGAPMTASELSGFLGGFRLESHAEALAFVDRFLGRPNPLRQVFAWGVRSRMGSHAVRELLERVSVQELLVPEELGAIGLPTLVFWGREDGVLGDAGRRFFREHLSARFVEPRGFGHAPHLDHLAGFLREVEAFLEELPRTEGTPRTNSASAGGPGVGTLPR